MKNPRGDGIVGRHGEENEACSECFCSLGSFGMKSLDKILPTTNLLL